MPYKEPQRQFHIELTPELAQTFQDLVDEHGMNRGAILERALRLYEIAKHAHSAGGKVIVRYPDGGLVNIVGI